MPMMRANKPPFLIHAPTGTRYEANGWSIQFIDDDGKRMSLGRENGKPFEFASVDDCNRAIRGLRENGITTMDDVMARERIEVVRICIESLGW